MRTTDFITELLCRVDDHMRDVPKHIQASLYPSEVVTLALLFAIKGVGNRALYRWIERDYLSLFPSLPERTRLFRLFANHKEWSTSFMAQPTLLGVADTYAIELLHPWRYGRSPSQIGKKGFSNHKWIVGGKLCLLLNKWGLVVDWDCATANVHDAAFQPRIAQYEEQMIAQYEEQMIVLADQLFSLKEGNPTNLLICKRGVWNVRMLIESVLSMLHTVCHLKHMAHRVWHIVFGTSCLDLLSGKAGLHDGGLQPAGSMERFAR